ncbi:helix-hairpin-helix domain-containing protein [Mycobacterium sp.]|uniref:helix-hairpin-helix domain-containing protein n=1 Tax=Mycobacterium sp. TaxID=1785 RepID=UPI003BABDB5E
MRSELPAERLHRRLGADPKNERGTHDGSWDCAPSEDPDQDSTNEAPDDSNSLLRSWFPDSTRGQGWVASVRADPGRAGAIALAAIAALAVLITVFTVMRDRRPPVMSAKLPPVERVSSLQPAASTKPAAAEGSDRPVVVSVVGLVRAPGLVTLAPGARVADALQAAGGAMDGADTIGLNMASQLDDGEQIVVGLAPVSGQPRALGSSVSPGRTATRGQPETVEVLDLNNATAAQLDALPGVGPVTAAAILAWRQEHGKFTSVDQLGDVDGIGPARLNKLRALVRV